MFNEYLLIINNLLISIPEGAEEIKSGVSFICNSGYLAFMEINKR